jgi:DUF3040 family protein
MSLPVGQQRTLDRIEHALQASEPHLASKFAIFSRLAFADGPIGRERISAPRLRHRLRTGLRAVTLIPVAIGLLITGIVLGGTAHGSGVCLRAWHSMTVAAARHVGCDPGTRPARPGQTSQTSQTPQTPRSPQLRPGMRNIQDHG